MFDFHTPERAGGASDGRPPGAVDDIVRDALPLLRGLARSRFSLPDDEVDSLVQNVLVRYLVRAEKVRDPRAYLVASLMNGARRLRAAGPSFEVSFDEIRDEPRQEQDDEIRQHLAGQILDRLDERCRGILKMRYYSGQTTREMAVELETTPGYAQKLVHKCLARALEICHKLENTRALRD
ncbi:MAG: sigma-70 family RNA polymerase sigma factor [Acidobacteria bacterium]|nr:sigma-70 family RNA polymerase sigma factor [Acidobacteriota bacterium]